MGHKKKKKKKNLAENLIAFYVFKKGLGVGSGKERKLQSRILWEKNFFWFIQRLLCVGYSKSSIHPHPGGKSSELHAWVVLHLTAAIQ